MDRGLITRAESWPVDLSTGGIAAIWDLCLSAEYDRELLVRGLAGWLGPADGLRVLDCACGSGFPSLDLHRLGYPITCTDGSPSMLEQFRHNASAAGVALEPAQARWEELDERYAARFDVVMCRGCSLIYAGTWDTDAQPNREALSRSLKSMVGCLAPGGRLYVDTTPEDELDDEYPQVTEHPPRTVDGRRVEVHEELTADPQARVRRWRVRLRVDDASYEFERMSHYVPHAELLELLGGAGLEDVSLIEVAGERYTVFVGQRA